MASKWRQARRKRRAACPECGAPRLLNARLETYRKEREELWAAVEELVVERDRLIQRLSGVRDDGDFPPPPGVRELGGARESVFGRLGYPSRSSLA